MATAGSAAVLAIVVAAAAASMTMDPLPKPVPNPARPTPYFSWDYIPLAFHGANRSGMYNAETVEVLGKHYQMVTIEKWYTECGSKHPIQNGPWCNVEASMYTTFNALKRINPNITNIMYLNSMMDFTMYNLHQLAEDLEDKGTRVWLRDKNDTKVIYCNDGNYYCNVLNWDWTKQAARDLYTSHVINATKQGGVDGIFADHASVRLSNKNNQICNGAGAQRTCYYFEPQFAAAFDAGHEWIVNHTQDMLAPLGPVIDGPYGKYTTSVCDFDQMRAAVQRGQAGTGPYVLEASHGGCEPNPSCIASYLLNAVEFTYLGCLSDEPQFNDYPDLARPLGPPTGPAILNGGVWARSFGDHGVTARWYVDAGKGTMQWAGQPVPPVPKPGPSPGPAPPSPPHPIPPQNVTASCGMLKEDWTIAQDDVGVQQDCISAQACCTFCINTAGCVQWAWHGHKQQCHAHGNHGTFDAQKGTYSARLPPKP